MQGLVSIENKEGNVRVREAMPYGWCLRTADPKSERGVGNYSVFRVKKHRSAGTES